MVKKVFFYQLTKTKNYQDKTTNCHHQRYSDLRNEMDLIDQRDIFLDRNKK